MTGAVTTRIARLMQQRGPGKTLCPSEIARDLAAGDDGDWRARMAQVHAAVDRLHAEGAIALTWKGQPLAGRDGPYRIGWPG